MISDRIVHPEASPLDIPEPLATPDHPGIERPEIIPPGSLPEQEPSITGLDRKSVPDYS